MRELRAFLGWMVMRELRALSGIISIVIGVGLLVFVTPAAVALSAFVEDEPVWASLIFPVITGLFFIWLGMRLRRR